MSPPENRFVVTVRKSVAQGARDVLTERGFYNSSTKISINGDEAQLPLTDDCDSDAIRNLLRDFSIKVIAFDHVIAESRKTSNTRDCLLQEIEQVFAL